MFLIENLCNNCRGFFVYIIHQNIKTMKTSTNFERYQNVIIKRLNEILKGNKGFDQMRGHSLSDLRTTKPNHTDKIKFVNLGSLLGKEIYNQFINVVKKEIGCIDSIVYSRICVEVSDIDGIPYIEISLNKNCQLPIAGSQYYILERNANKFDMSLVGYVDSLNYILNDSRNFK